MPETSICPRFCQEQRLATCLPSSELGTLFGGRTNETGNRGAKFVILSQSDHGCRHKVRLLGLSEGRLANPLNDCPVFAWRGRQVS